LVRETGATYLFHSREYEPFGIARDRRVRDALQSLGVTVTETHDHLLQEPETFQTQAGKPYTIFTPYKRAWLERAVDAPQPAPERVVTPPNVVSESLPLTGNAWTSPTDALKRFLVGAGSQYATGRETPGTRGTSGLSAFFRMGAISLRVAYHAAQDARANLPLGERYHIDTWVSELIWRDFYYQILTHFPHVETGAFKPQWDALAWENDEKLFVSWQTGQTGYPLIDAAQRELLATGFMHNRARMATASFLTKDLLCDWQWGERFFMQHLVDGDLAANNGGWQWAAGTGTDAQPYFRIFNPVAQGEKFDPDGAYVKRWCPELKSIPAKFVHAPWLLRLHEQEAVGCVLGKHYPKPVVDHKVQREKALQLYRRIAQGE
jgi:deoxyribodipyrimidine photo-lyase